MIKHHCCTCGTEVDKKNITTEYYCDLCGSRTYDPTTYILPFEQCLNTAYDPYDLIYVENGVDITFSWGVVLCHHCSLRLRNFIKNEMTPSGERYLDMLRKFAPYAGGVTYKKYLKQLKEEEEGR